MSKTTQFDTDALPSSRSLLKATGVAIAVAALVLVTAVLPAEYGIDPTGIGATLGLKSMSAGTAVTAPEAKPVAEAPEPTTQVEASPASPLPTVWKSPTPYRTDELSLQLRPNEGAEIKAQMRKGERFVFTWVADGGAVNFDMHGERPDAKQDDFTSYWKGRSENSGHGAFEAPFDGTHGWYWRNRGQQPVTVRVKTSGFYDKLYRP